MEALIPHLDNQQEFNTFSIRKFRFDWSRATISVKNAKMTSHTSVLRNPVTGNEYKERTGFQGVLMWTETR